MLRATMHIWHTGKTQGRACWSAKCSRGKRSVICQGGWGWMTDSAASFYKKIFQSVPVFAAKLPNQLSLSNGVSSLLPPCPHLWTSLQKDLHSSIIQIWPDISTFSFHFHFYFVSIGFSLTSASAVLHSWMLSNVAITPKYPFTWISLAIIYITENNCLSHINTLHIHICLLIMLQRLRACVHAVNHSMTVGVSLTVSVRIFQRVPHVLLLALHQWPNAWLMQSALLLQYNQRVRCSRASNDDLHTPGHQWIHSWMLTQSRGNDAHCATCLNSSDSQGDILTDSLPVVKSRHWFLVPTFYCACMRYIRKINA